MHVNNDFQRICNTSQVFETIWREKEISRIDIARKLEVYRSTVSNIIDVLLENQIICEGQRGNVSEKGGRKPIFLSINKDYGAILGLEIQPEYYNAAILNFCGETIYSKTEALTFTNKRENSEEEFTALLDSIINPLLKQAQQDGLKLLGICVAVPGIIDTERGIIKNSVPFNIKNLDFASIFNSRYNLPVLVENDAKCCAWLHKGQCDEVKDFICVLTRQHAVNGFAVGLSVVMNDKIINGHNFAAGEYVSISWRKDKNGQTGLPEAVLKTVDTVEDSYSEWVKDLFSTLTVMIPLLEPCKIYVHGQKKEKADLIKNIIVKKVSQFQAALEQFGAELEIYSEDDFEIARGAALMYLQKLCDLPYLMNDYFYPVLNWDTLFNK